MFGEHRYRGTYSYRGTYCWPPFRHMKKLIYTIQQLFLPVSYQLPLVSASWLRCAFGSEWREHEAFVSLCIAPVLFEPWVNLIFEAVTVLLFTVSSLSLFQVSTTRYVKKCFRTFSLQCCLRMVREWPLRPVAVRSWKKSSRFTRSKLCIILNTSIKSLLNRLI